MIFSCYELSQWKKLLLTNHGNAGKSLFFSKMTSKSAGGNAQKQEVSGFTGVQKAYVDKIKEDGIRKELYEKERKAKEKWGYKWGFLENPKKLWEEAALKRGLPANFDVFEKKNEIYKNLENFQNLRNIKIELLPSKGFPKLSSEMIGWRAFSKENNLNLLTGPDYISRKQTMNPPLSPEEPDLRYQSVIFLG